MARRIGKRNEMKVDFGAFGYLVNAIAGYGKTTMAHEIGEKLYGEEGTLIVTIGREPEPKHIDGCFYEKVEDWDGIEELVEELCENKADYPNTRIVALDSVDELFRLAETQIVKEYNKTVSSDKRTKVIGACYGGFQRGENRVCDLVVNTIFKIQDYGYCPFFIGHTKVRQKVDQMTEISYELLSSSLDAKYYNTIKDKVNIVATGYVERNMEDIKAVKDAFSKGEKQVGKLVGEKRVMSFRDQSFAIDTKSHFKNIPEKIDFSTDNFIQTITDAIKSDLEEKRGKKVTDKEIEQLKEAQANEAVEPKKKQPKIDVAKNKQYIELITKSLDSIDFNQMQVIMAEYDVASLKDVESIQTVCLEKIAKLI